MTSRRILSAAIAATLALGTYQAYAYDENFKGYEVHNVSVKADAAKDEYGNTIRPTAPPPRPSPRRPPGAGRPGKRRCR